MSERWDTVVVGAGHNGLACAGYLAKAGLRVAVVELGVFWLFRWRSRSGLRLKNYQAILDRRRSHVGRFLVCGQPYDFTRGLALTVVSSSMPSPRRRHVPDVDVAADLFSRAR